MIRPRCEVVVSEVLETASAESRLCVGAGCEREERGRERKGDSEGEKGREGGRERERKGEREGEKGRKRETK